MNRCNLLVLFGLSVMIPAGAQAQSVRTWVSANGVDNSQCSRSSPCRTFSAAISAVNADGEVVVLDSAGYGPVTIDKGVTILAPAGVHAAIAPTAGNAITINSGITGAVILRGLYLNGQGATNGIRHLGNNDLFVDGCVVNGFNADGIVFEIGTTPQFSIVASTMRSNGDCGIEWFGSSPGRGVVEHSRLENNGFSGLCVESSGNITVRDTTAALNGASGIYLVTNAAGVDITDSAAVNNGDFGFYAQSNGTSGVNMHLERCLSSRNNTGIRSEASSGTATIRVSNCLITNNGAGVTAGTGGSIQSRGNNTLENNVSGNTFPASYTAK